MKRVVRKALLMALVATAFVLATAAPAFAQPNDATLTFELTVLGVPPPDAIFFGRVPIGEGGPGVCAPLTDPDGDGVYTGSASVPSSLGGGPPVTAAVTIVQGTGQAPTSSVQVRCPEPLSALTVIKDFGSVLLVDQTLSATVSFLPGEGGKELPPTGGAGIAPLLALGGALLGGGGLLARGLLR